MPAVDLVRIEIGDGRAVLHLSEARHRAGVEQQLRHECRLARVIVSDDRDVADLHELDSPGGI
jgi:hypothetical protein